MKRILTWLVLLVLIGYGSTGGSIGTPDVKTTTWLNVPFEAVDTTTGVGRIPDSVSVIMFFGNCTNAGIFQVSSASLDSNWWDSTQTGAGAAGSKIYYFKEVIADVDADSGAGFYSGVINAWFQGYPMPTYFSFNLVDTTAQEYGSLNYFIINGVVDDSLGAAKQAILAVIDDSLGNLKSVGTKAADTVLVHAPHGNNWASTLQVWSNDQRDSILNTIEDANKPNYKASGFATSADGDSVTQAIADANKANFKADVSGLSTHSAGDVWAEDTGGVALTKYGGAVLDHDDYKATDLSVEIDSLLSAFYDRANDTSFIRILSQYVLKHLYPDSVTIDNSNAWDLSGGTDLSVEVDSILATLYDRTNDTAFVLILSQYVLKHLYPDSVTIDNSNAWDLVGAGGVDLSDEVDSLLSAIYDRANDTSFVRIIAQYVLLRLHPDSLRAFLATGDSTRLEQAAACGSGTGARTVTITVKNAADSVAISGFEIDVYDSSSGEPQANGTTNSNGVYTCSLDDETYTVHITNPPWSLTSPRRFVITGDMDSTFYATRFTPGSPPADSLCVVYGYVKKSNGDPYVGAKVSIGMNAYPVTFGGILIDVVTKRVVYTNTDGRFEFSEGIYYSSSLNPSNLKWTVRIKTTNWLWEDKVLVPSQASWEIEIPVR